MEIKEKESVVVRFSGDSGDGMQLAGNIFSTVSATVGAVSRCISVPSRSIRLATSAMSSWQ